MLVICSLTELQLLLWPWSRPLEFPPSPHICSTCLIINLQNPKWLRERFCLLRKKEERQFHIYLGVYVELIIRIE